MNWKKWVGLLGAGCGMLLIPALLLMFGMTTVVVSPQKANADTYQLATSSFTVILSSVNTAIMTQVDTPQLAGRTSIEIYNLDTSSPIYCGQNPNISTNTLSNAGSGCPVQFSTCAAILPLRPIPPAPTTAIAGSNWWSLSLSNFASNRGAYPVSVSMPIYCVSGRSTSGTVVFSSAIVTQSY